MPVDCPLTSAYMLGTGPLSYTHIQKYVNTFNFLRFLRGPESQASELEL